MHDVLEGGDSPVPGRMLSLSHRPVYGTVFPARASWFICLIVLLTCAAESHSAQPGGEQFDPPLTTQEERRQFELNRYRTFQQALQANNPNAQEIAVLQEGARYYLYGLTLENLRRNLPRGVTEDLMNDIFGPLATENARRVVCQEIVDRADELFGQPHEVRLNLALMLRRLNIRPIDFQSQRPAIPFVPAAMPLMGLLEHDTTRKDAKIWAAEGLGRICEDSVTGVRDGDLTFVVRADIGMALSRVLNGPQAHESDAMPFRLTLVEALGKCGLARNAAREPFMIEALMARLVDENEHDLVRSMSAWSLSRLGRPSEPHGYTPDTNFPLVVFEVVRYNRYLAELMINRPNLPHTRRAIVYLYFSFNGQSPPKAAEQRIGWNHQLQRSGLGQHRAMVESAYNALKPLYTEVFSNTSPNVTPAMIADIDAWLQTHVPLDRKVTPQSEPLPEIAGPVRETDSQ